MIVFIIFKRVATLPLSEWVSQSSNLLQPVDDQLDRGDLVQRLLSLRQDERTGGLREGREEDNLVGEEASSNQANLLQQLLCLGDEGNNGDTKKESSEQPDLLHQLLHLDDGQPGKNKKYFNDADIVDEVLVLEQENEFNSRLGDVELFQNLHTLDHKAFVDKDIKTEMTDDNMTEDDDNEVEMKEEIPHDRHISTVIYKNRSGQTIVNILSALSNLSPAR